jgi:hypothetical protein
VGSARGDFPCLAVCFRAQVCGDPFNPCRCLHVTPRQFRLIYRTSRHVPASRCMSEQTSTVAGSSAAPPQPQALLCSDSNNRTCVVVHFSECWGTNTHQSTEASPTGPAAPAPRPTGRPVHGSPLCGSHNNRREQCGPLFRSQGSVFFDGVLVALLEKHCWSQSRWLAADLQGPRMDTGNRSTGLWIALKRVSPR